MNYETKKIDCYPNPAYLSSMILTSLEEIRNRLISLESRFPEAQGQANQWLDCKEAARYLKMNRAALAHLAHLNKIKHGSVGGRKYRFLKEYLDSYLLSNGRSR